MSAEYPRPNPFELTDQEQLHERMSHTRFLALVLDERTSVHHISLSTNTFGEFLFVTLSRVVEDQRLFCTFWGLGYHEQRERWFTGEWRWYETTQLLHMMPQAIAKADVQALIQARLEEIQPLAQQSHQSERGKLFETLADLTDDDSAYTDFEDLDNLGWWLLGREE